MSDVTLPLGYAQARTLVRSAFALEPTRVRRLSAQDTVVYRVETPAGSFVLRSHGRESDAEIASVPLWLEALRVDGIDAPEPIRARDGGFVAERCTLVRFVPGRIHRGTPRLVHFERLGRTMAALHRHAEAWTPPPTFIRPSWRAAEVFCEAGRSLPPGRDPWALVPPALEPLLRDATERARGPLDEAPALLIHADLHLGNVVFAGGAATPFDFDDTGYGPLGYDVACALSKQRPTTAWPRVLDRFRRGYGAVRDGPDLSQLDAYIAGRLAGIVLWLLSTAETEPRVRAGLVKWIPHFEDQLRLLRT